MKNSRVERKAPYKQTNHNNNKVTQKQNWKIVDAAKSKPGMPQCLHVRVVCSKIGSQRNIIKSNE